MYVLFDYPLEKLSFAERMKLRMARAARREFAHRNAMLCVGRQGARRNCGASSYNNRVRLVVVESGASRVNQWLTFERDVTADFKAAFGIDAPMVTAVAIASDTDNTGESVVAHCGDISFNKHGVIK
jgi:hypothetical protein